MTTSPICKLGRGNGLWIGLASVVSLAMATPALVKRHREPLLVTNVTEENDRKTMEMLQRIR